jgi:hypothetical protein
MKFIAVGTCLAVGLLNLGFFAFGSHMWLSLFAALWSFFFTALYYRMDW